MTALVIIGIIVGIIVFIYVGYYLWSSAMDRYDYNIFNLGVIIRGLLSLGCVFLSLAMLNEEDSESGLVFIAVAVLLWIWTFIVTLIRTNIFIALFSIVYQFIAILFVNSAIKRILN